MNDYTYLINDLKASLKIITDHTDPFELIPVVARIQGVISRLEAFERANEETLKDIEQSALDELTEAYENHDCHGDKCKTCIDYFEAMGLDVDYLAARAGKA